MKYKEARFSIINEYKTKMNTIFTKYWNQVYDFMLSKEDVYQDLYLMYDVVETYIKLAVENRERQYIDASNMLQVPVKEAYSSEIWDVFRKYVKDEYIDHLPIVVTFDGLPIKIDITGVVDTLSRDISKELKEGLILICETFEFEAITLSASIIKKYLDSQKEFNKCTNELQRFLYSDVKKFKKECIYIRDEYIQGLAETECEVHELMILLTEENFRIEPNKPDKVEFKNIYDPKDMVKLAEQSNFKYIRSRGDHDIYKNEDSGAITVIPQHTLCKSLSIAIQKQIMKGSNVNVL